MLTKTTLALAFVLGAVSFASAQDADPNLLNRYPAYNMTKQSWSPSFAARNAAMGHHTMSEHVQFDRASWSTGQ